MRKRRILAWLMAMVMAIGLMPATAFAATDDEGNLSITGVDSVYELKDGGLSTSELDGPKYIGQRGGQFFIAFVTQHTRIFDTITFNNDDNPSEIKGIDSSDKKCKLTIESTNPEDIKVKDVPSGQSEKWQVVWFNGKLEDKVENGKIAISWKMQNGGGHDGVGNPFTVEGWPAPEEPEDSSHLTISKERVTQVAGTVEWTTVDELPPTFEAGTSITVAEGEDVTLLYAVTVTNVPANGSQGTSLNYAVTDTGAEYVGYTSDSHTPAVEDGKVTGTLDADEVVVLYFTKTFENLTPNNAAVTNEATVTWGENGEAETDPVKTEITVTPGGSTDPEKYTVKYKYTGDYPADAPFVPAEKEYDVDKEVEVEKAPTLNGYTFSGWKTTDVEVSDGKFVMPTNDVTLTGFWTKSGPSISRLDKRPVAVNLIPVLTNDLGYYKWDESQKVLLKKDGRDWEKVTLKENDVVTYQITLENSHQEELTDVKVTDNLFGKATNIKYSTYGKKESFLGSYYNGYIDINKSVEAENNTITIPRIPVGYGNEIGKCEITYSYKVDKNNTGDFKIDNTTGNYVLHNKASVGNTTDSVDIPTNIKADETKYTVTFYYNYTGAPYDGIYAKVPVKKGDTVTAPDDNPTRPGDYTFLYWTTDEAGEYKYDFNTPVNEDLHLYAKWQAEVHSVKKVASRPVYTDAGQKIQYFVLLENHNTEDINVLVKDKMLDGAKNIYYVRVDKLIAGRPEPLNSNNGGKVTVPVPAQYKSSVKADIEKILDAIFGGLIPGKKTMDFGFDLDDLDDLDWEDILSKLGGFEGCDKLPDFELPECGNQEIVIPGYTILTYTYTTTDGDVEKGDIVNKVTVGRESDSATVKYEGCTIPEIGDLEFHTMFKKAIENKVNDTLGGNYTVDNGPFNLGVNKINVKAGSTTAKGIAINNYNGVGDNDHWWTENSNNIIDDVTKVDGLEIKVLTGWDNDGLFKQFVYQTVPVDKDHIRLHHGVKGYITEIYLGFDVTFKAKDDNGGWKIVPCNGENTNVVFFDSKDGGTITPPQVEGEDVTWYTDAACTQEWNGKIVRNTTLYTGDPDTPVEETIVRFYLENDALTEAGYVPTDLNDKIWVGAGFAHLKSVKSDEIAAGENDGDVASDDVKDACAALFTGKALEDAVKVVLPTVDFDNYKVELRAEKPVVWECENNDGDISWHVHYVLVPKEIIADEASISIEKEINENDTRPERGEWVRYTITVTNDGDVTLTNIVVTEKPGDVFSEGKFVTVPDNATIDADDANKVTIDELEAGESVILAYKAKVDKNADRNESLKNKVEVSAKAGEETVKGDDTENKGSVYVPNKGGIPSKNRPTKPSKVEEVLNTEDHFQYVQGYPDNTVGPERNITRAEATVIFFRLLNDSVRTKYLDADNAFADVNLNDWFNLGVSTMENGGFVSGYDDGLFRPNAYITRAELATIISNFDDLEPAAENKFADVEGHWAEKYINSAAEKGWLSGYEDGLFRPNQYITRAETMSMINRVLDRRVDADGLHAAAKQWKDNPESKWYYYAVLEATNYHEYEREDVSDYENWTAIKAEKVWEN